MSMEVCRHVTGRQRSTGQTNKCVRYIRGCSLDPHWAQVLENAMGKNASERPEDMQELCAFICTAQTAISQVTHTRASTCMRARAEKHTHGSAHTRHVQISGKSDEFWTNLWGWHEESGGSDTIEVEMPPPARGWALLPDHSEKKICIRIVDLLTDSTSRKTAGVHHRPCRNGSTCARICRGDTSAWSSEYRVGHSISSSIRETKRCFPLHFLSICL